MLSKSDLDQIQVELDKLIPKHMPVGTIISSLINYHQFVDIVGDEIGFNKETSKWAPADGRDVTGSLYYKYNNGEAHVPDLRGVFLRGLNTFDDSEEKPVLEAQMDMDGLRKVGRIQNDSIKKHEHPIQGTANSAGGGEPVITLGLFHGGTTIRLGNNNKAEPIGELETRPKNAAVNYYIKIN